MKPVALLVAATALSAQTLTVQTSGTNASLRGVWAVNERVVWASGTHGTFLKTTVGGATWTAATVEGAEGLDFRDVQGVDENTAYLLSIGTGETSRVYKTSDGGAHWSLSLQNPDAKGFFDEMAFWNPQHGILAGDQVDGQMVVMTTEDGGKTWQRQKLPPALPGEGAFAASGTGITVFGEKDVWIGTGGKGAARVYHSSDAGRTWTVAATPMRDDSAAAGIFSLAFSDAKHGIAVGGDYNKANDETGNVAVTSDGGATWVKPEGTPPKGFRSAVAYLADRKIWIAAGPSGADASTDGGKNWRQFDSGNYNALSFASSNAGWAVGARGRIAVFRWQ
ncbi:MAG TPA: YCF48-related protein [Bryobacteraceae bacterium]|nr:YCF48-related protein [Bryobacteraceae bacterium]